MQTQKTYSALVTNLRDCLTSRGYTEYADANIPGVGDVGLIMTPRRWTIRYVCAVTETPQPVATVAQCKDLFTGIRGALSRQYARLPWYKELGTYLILLCPTLLCQQLSGHVSAFHDRTGLHVNVMLGTVFVDRERYESSAEATWGLFYSGRHFLDIQRAVGQWCKTQRAA
jgi:hypothetical protein